MMKKTLLALAVPAAIVAGSANAAVNVYNANGLIVDFGGAAEIQYYKGQNKAEDMYLRIDDGDLYSNIQVEVAPGLKVIGTMGFSFEGDQADVGTMVNDDLFVGMVSDFGTLTFGRQCMVIDGSGIGKDIEFSNGGVNIGPACGPQVIKWAFDNGGMFYGGASTYLDSDITSANTGTSAIDGMIGVRYAGVDARVFLVNNTNATLELLNGSVYSGDNTMLSAEINYAYQAFDFAASYQMATNDKMTLNGTALLGEIDETSFEIAAGYQADEKTYIAIGFNMSEADYSDANLKVEQHSLYSNVTYKMHSNAKVYAELGMSDIEIANVDEDLDLGYVVGMEVSF